MPDVLAIIYGCLVGLSLGLTGSGGSIFAIPLLVYGLKVPVREAITISLLAVALTSSLGLIGPKTSQTLSLKKGTFFALAGMLGAPLGTLLGHHLPDTLLLQGFALLMLLIGINMWQKKTPKKADSQTTSNTTPPSHPVILITAVMVGLLSGLFGAGGGFLIVPALVWIYKMELRQAMTTSLFVVALIATSALTSHLLSQPHLPWALTGLFVGGGMLGIFAGRSLRHHFSQIILSRIFASTTWIAAFVILLQTLF